MPATMLFYYLAPVAAVISAILLLPSLDPKELINRWQGRTWADLVVMNATIYTSDPALPFAEAMAVRDNRILQVGDFSSIQELVGHKTYKLNLNGSVVVPGFIESHLHFISGGLQNGGGISLEQNFHSWTYHIILSLKCQPLCHYHSKEQEEGYGSRSLLV